MPSASAGFDSFSSRASHLPFVTWRDALPARDYIKQENFKMGKDIDELVRMNDAQTMFELMEDSDDWMMQLDAAEGLAKLGERAGLDYLLSAGQSDAREVREYAREILDDPATKRKVDEIEAEEKRKFAEKVL